MRTTTTAALFFLALAATAQEPNDVCDLLRSDLRNDREAIVMATLHLTEDQRTLFMPIYNEYTEVLKKEWEGRLALIDDYTANRETMDNEDATGFMKRLFELERNDLDLREKYAAKVVKVLPTTIAMRWVRIERRLGQLMELQVTNLVPQLPEKD